MKEPLKIYFMVLSTAVKPLNISFLNSRRLVKAESNQDLWRSQGVKAEWAVGPWKWSAARLGMSLLDFQKGRNVKISYLIPMLTCSADSQV